MGFGCVNGMSVLSYHCRELFPHNLTALARSLLMMVVVVVV